MPLVANIITSLAGRAVGQTIGGAAAGPVGMVLGAALPFVARRLGPLGMVGLAVGAWAVGKVLAAQAKPEPIVTLPLPDLVPGTDPAPSGERGLIQR